MAALAAIGIHRDLLASSGGFQVRSVDSIGIKCQTLEEVKDCLDRRLDKEIRKLRNLQEARDLE